MRDEIKTLKEDKRKCEEEKDKLYNQVHLFLKQMAEFQVAFKQCQINHFEKCPLVNRKNEVTPDVAPN